MIGFLVDASRLLNILELISVRLDIMSQQFDDLNAHVQAMSDSNAKLVALANDIKAKLDAAVAAGTGLTADEVTALSASLDSMKAADDAAVAADTPAP